MVFRNVSHGHLISALILIMNLSTILLPSVVIGQPTQDETHFTYEPNQFLQSYQSFREELYQTSQSTSKLTSKLTSKDQECAARSLIVAAVQLKTLPSSSHNIHTPAQDFFHRAITAIETAVQEHNATLVVLPELFMGPYFCQSQEASLFALAEDLSSSSSSPHPNPLLLTFQNLAQQHNVILPISIFERANNVYFNTVIMIDSDGSILGKYRKSHIPDGTGYQEKFYFSPGDTGFQVFASREGYTIGVGICWDQWFPEAARAMALQGADVLLYPTAIGTEPQDPTLDSSQHWQRVMQGHAAANVSYFYFGFYFHYY